MWLYIYWLEHNYCLAIRNCNCAIETVLVIGDTYILAWNWTINLYMMYTLCTHIRHFCNNSIILRRTQVILTVTIMNVLKHIDTQKIYKSNSLAILFLERRVGAGRKCGWGHHHWMCFLFMLLHPCCNLKWLTI